MEDQKDTQIKVSKISTSTNSTSTSETGLADEVNSKPAKKKKCKGKKIKLIEGFMATPALLYETFTDPKMVQTFTRAPANLDLKVGGKFSFFDGSITGEFLELIPNTKIVQKWRFNDWEDGIYSKVTVDLKAVDDYTCKVTLTQTGIPEDDKYGNHYQKNKCKEGWKNFYWKRIHKILGYGEVKV